MQHEQPHKAQQEERGLVPAKAPSLGSLDISLTQWTLPAPCCAAHKHPTHLCFAKLPEDRLPVWRADLLMRCKSHSRAVKTAQRRRPSHTHPACQCCSLYRSEVCLGALSLLSPMLPAVDNGHNNKAAQPLPTAHTLSFALAHTSAHPSSTPLPPPPPPCRAPSWRLKIRATKPQPWPQARVRRAAGSATSA